MPKTLTVYYALQSPWTYLGWPRFSELAADNNLDVVYRPIKMAPVFAASGGLPLAKRPVQRQAYRMMELKRWRDVLGIPLTLEPMFFPTDEQQAALMVIAHERHGGDIGSLSFAMMRAVWAENRDLSDQATLTAIASEQKADGPALLAAAQDQPAAEAYEDNTQAALKAGVFGVPTFAVGDELFWGQDRLDLLARALA
jgi:2-hydroxychromene-2-carboxylate isomerase